jgi:BirA family biotin operon repressor/biotin-[acetyl-CoA-carboxylase] ligase
VIAGERLPEGFVLDHRERVGSTNDELAALAAKGAPAGTVLIADEQTRGKGRSGRLWHSPKGNLHASILLRPDCPLARTAELSLVASVALSDALIALGPEGLDLTLKWPNDILIDGAKTAGILLESSAGSGGRTAWVIVGAGVNIGARPTGTPYPVTSLEAAGFARITPATLVRAFAQSLLAWLERWQTAGFGEARRLWRNRSHRLGEQVSVRLEREEIGGRFVDLSEHGALILELPDGSRREIAVGDVSFP